MRTITRYALIDAIMGATHEVGIDKVPADAYCALLRVGYRTAAVGDTYLAGPGCPAIQAGIVTTEQALNSHTDDGWPSWLTEWVDAYDDRAGSFELPVDGVAEVID